jgi:hypothetical protein
MPMMMGALRRNPASIFVAPERFVQFTLVIRSVEKLPDVTRSRRIMGSAALKTFAEQELDA